MFELRQEDLGFVERAPLRLVFAATLRASQKAVFDAVASDPAAWPSWFNAVSRCEYGGDGPYGVGTRRRVLLTGGVAFHETIIAWDDPTRYAYRVDRCSVPGVRALVEEWSLLEVSDGTRVVWMMAIDATAPARIAIRAAAPGVGLSFRRAAQVLDRRLSADNR